MEKKKSELSREVAKLIDEKLDDYSNPVSVLSEIEEFIRQYKIDCCDLEKPNPWFDEDIYTGELPEPERAKFEYLAVNGKWYNNMEFSSWEELQQKYNLEEVFSSNITDLLGKCKIFKQKNGVNLFFYRERKKKQFRNFLDLLKPKEPKEFVLEADNIGGKLMSSCGIVYWKPILKIGGNKEQILNFIRSLNSGEKIAVRKIE